ncbi:MAG TPA: patatin-like phospholipase family protein [Solirubrobacterales bacterium]|nr:patatin-like phospholipase family protein [Solirubrobacterales bacterium]
MAEPGVPRRDFESPGTPKFAILSVDGGGIRGLIPALVLARLERLVADRRPGATLTSGFQLISGTSTGGLIALGLTTPDAEGKPALDARAMVDLYRGPEAQEIFSRPPLERLPVINRASDLLDPRYGLDGLRAVLEDRFGDRTLAEALSGVLVSAYDMQARTPRFFKPWNSEAAEVTAVEAGLATSAAPTYFPALELGEAALVDGGVFVNNPTIAATIEALKRTEGDPLRPEDLLVISVGTGQHERGYDPAKVRGWGQAGWILPGQGGEPPLIGAMLDGQSDASHHWAHILLNHRPGTPVARGPDLGAGPRYFRWQVELPAPLPLDGVSDGDLDRLTECGEALIEGRAAEIEAVAAALVAASGDP